MDRDQIEELFYGRPEQQRRFTQDFPVLPDVWIAYGREPAERVEVLLTPHNEADAAKLAQALRQRLASDSGRATSPVARTPNDQPDRPRVLFNESVVLASLSFRELLRDAMPLTLWWKNVVTPIGGVWGERELRAFAEALGTTDASSPAGGADPRLLQKLIRIVGCIELDRQGRPTPLEILADSQPLPAEIEAFATLFDALPAVAPDAAGLLWSVRQSPGEHRRVAIAPDGQGRRRGSPLRTEDVRHPLGGARYRNRRHAQGLRPPRRGRGARARPGQR